MIVQEEWFYFEVDDLVSQLCEEEKEEGIVCLGTRSMELQ